jgi:hypothetical protein
LCFPHLSAIILRIIEREAETMATALRKRFRLIMILAWLLSGPACVINLMDLPYERSASRNAFHRILAMEPGGTIQLENEEGDIEIRGWERDEVEITAEAEFLPPFRPGFSVSSWGPPRPRIQVTSSEDFVKIKSPSLEENRVVGAIHYILNVPKSVDLKDIRNENGDITITDVFGEIAIDLGEGDLIIENFSGSVEVSVDLGTVEADLLDLREEDEIRIVSMGTSRFSCSRMRTSGWRPAPRKAALTPNSNSVKSSRRKKCPERSGPERPLSFLRRCPATSPSGRPIEPFGLKERRHDGRKTG